MTRILENNPDVFPSVTQVLWAVLAGALLALSYPNFNLNILAWIALVPLLFAVSSATSLRHAYFLGLISGMSGISIGFYWVAFWASNALKITFPLNILFVLGFAFCFGQIFGVVTLFYKWFNCYSKVSKVFTFPVVLVTVFSIFPLLFSFSLSDSQWKFPLAIQSIDVTGTWGLDFVIAMFNGLVFHLCLDFSQVRKGLATIVALCIICIWFATGWVKLSFWDKEIAARQNKKIGIVQPNRIATLTKPVPLEGYSREYPLEMQLSEQLTGEKVDLLVWPEGHFFGYSFWDSVKESFHDTVANQRTPLVFYDATRRLSGEEEKAYNTIHFLNERGNLEARYDKIKLVPFSEYMPLFDKVPLFDWILGDYLDNLTPGDEAKVVTLAGMKLVPKVCYEPLFPGFVAGSIGKNGAGKVLVVQSQDGWFGETSQPYQHLAVTMMRAVENRVPLIHVIQNGPSGVINPNGRFAFISRPFTRGSWIAEMPFDSKSGGSFYSRYPTVFINFVRVICLLIIIESIVRRKTS